MLTFLALFLRLLKIGGRAAVIVPDGVLFGSSKAHKDLRKKLVEENKLDAVIKLTSRGVRRRTKSLPRLQFSLLFRSGAPREIGTLDNKSRCQFIGWVGCTSDDDPIAGSSSREPRMLGAPRRSGNERAIENREQSWL